MEEKSNEELKEVVTENIEKVEPIKEDATSENAEPIKEAVVTENTTHSTNGLAISGFVVALCSLILNFGGIVGLVATILSAVGLAKVKEKGSGKGMAITGLIIGIISICYGIWSIFRAATIIGSLF